MTGLFSLRVMPLKIYNKLDDVPEALREFYKLTDGRYLPDLAPDHPVLVHNNKLLTEKSADSAKIKELETDIEEAKKTSVPRGHVAVAKADAQLLEEVKALGKIEDLKLKLTEHETLKTEVDKRKREDGLKLVAKELGYDNVDAFIRLPLPEMEIREKDGKKLVIAKVADDKGVVTEKPAVEFMESHPDIAPFLGALKTAGEGTRVPVSGSRGGNRENDPFKASRDFANRWNESAKAETNVAERFGLAKAAS